MDWQDCIAFNQSEYDLPGRDYKTSRMMPGMAGQYDRQLREKASVRGQPLPPDCMGLEGEYDPCGLAKRVAAALNDQQQLAELQTLTLAQKGSTIVYYGHVEDRQTLDKIIETTAQVDGTHAIDVDQVSVAAP